MRKVLMGIFHYGDPLDSVPPSRHPFQVWVLAALMVSGVSTLFKFGQPRTLDELLPAFMVAVWGFTMMVGGAAGLIAAWLQDAITGRLLERLALIAIGGMSVVYAVAIMTVAGSIGITSTCLLLGIGAAAYWRVRQLNREITILTRWAGRRDNEGDGGD